MFGVLVKLFSQLVFDGLSTSLIVTVAPLGFTWSIIKKKSEEYSCFQKIYKIVCTQFNTKVQVLRSDNGTKYIDKTFQSYFIDHSIIHQTSRVDTPNQNGMAERKTWHLLEVARSLCSRWMLQNPIGMI